MKRLLLTLALILLSLPALAAEPETAYDRVMRTHTLRCGYIPYSYFFRVDPNTGEKSGVMYDVVNEMGRLLQLKVEWAEELTWATVVTSLQTGRVDAMCSGIWVDTQNGRFMAYTQPLFFNSISAYGRADETRFAKLADLDDPAVQVATRDGGTSGIIATQDFPKARLVSLASGVSDGEMLALLTTKKADVIFYGDDYMVDYMQHNPGQLKNLFPGVHLRTYATTIGLPMTDLALQNMFASAITELKGSHFIPRALAAHAPAGSWLETP